MNIDINILIKEDKEYIIGTYDRGNLFPEKGEGPYLWDYRGKKYLDFLGGIAVNILGHGHPRIVKAVNEQAQKLIHCSNLYYIVPQIQLAKALVEAVGLKAKVFFANSGAEANEGAIKLARKWGRVTKGENCYEIITAYKSFHGRTMGSLAATGQKKYQEDFKPLPEGFKYVKFNSIQDIEESLSENTCAVMVEIIQGEGGINVADINYLHRLRQICDENQVLLIIDEVQTGMGRTGKFFAFQHYEIEPDIITLAKGLGGGIPIGAFIAGEKVSEILVPGDHGSTFGGNPLATRVALEVVNTLIEENLPHHAAEMGDYLIGKLEELKEEFPDIVEVRGRGLMVGMELNYKGKIVIDRCMEQGLLINCTEERVLRFLPPLIIERNHIDEAVEILRGVLESLKEEEKNGS